MKKSSKAILNRVGSLLAVVGIIFVGFRLYDYSNQLDFSNFILLDWCKLAGLSIVYGIANILLGLAWCCLLRHFGTPVLRTTAIYIYGVTQLAKYVPGNIMHIASRQAKAVASGMEGWAVAKASFWELGLLSITGAFFVILLLPQVWPILSLNNAVICFVFSVLLMAFGIHSFLGINAVKTFGLYLLFLSISGLVFVGSLTVIISINELDVHISTHQIISITGAFVIAWLVGLVTPGAPAGVGVREIILLFLLGGLVGEASLVVAIVLSRFISVGGDVLFFFISGGLRGKEI